MCHTIAIPAIPISHIKALAPRRMFASPAALPATQAAPEAAATAAATAAVTTAVAVADDGTGVEADVATATTSLTTRPEGNGKIHKINGKILGKSRKSMGKRLKKYGNMRIEWDSDPCERC